MRLLLFKLIFLAAWTNAPAQRCKLITPGEHSGYALESFNAQNVPVKTTIRQGESWVAVYVKDGRFSTRPEVLTWDKAVGVNFTIASKGTQQPMFYVQGLPSLRQKGPCTTFAPHHPAEPPQLRTWSRGDTVYVLTYARDPAAKKLAPCQYATFTFDQPMTLFKGVDPKLVRQVKTSAQHEVFLSWTGDLNGDGEPDFLLALPTHHETISLELLVSRKTAQGVTWVRKARFTEWS